MGLNGNNLRFVWNLITVVFETGAHILKLTTMW